VLELVRELYLDKLMTPDAYAADPVEAVARYCGRFQQLLTWAPQARTVRLAVSVAERLPVSAQAHFDSLFETMYARLAEFLVEKFSLDSPKATVKAEELVGRTVLPTVLRVLLGAAPPIEAMPGAEPVVENVELEPIRRAVAETLG
jgi:hypothetical protein